jgi:hypothetical protein
MGKKKEAEKEKTPRVLKPPTVYNRLDKFKEAINTKHLKYIDAHFEYCTSTYHLFNNYYQNQKVYVREDWIDHLYAIVYYLTTRYEEYIIKKDYIEPINPKNNKETLALVRCLGLDLHFNYNTKKFEGVHCNFRVRYTNYRMYVPVNDYNEELLYIRNVLRGSKINGVLS